MSKEIDLIYLENMLDSSELISHILNDLYRRTDDEQYRKLLLKTYDQLSEVETSLIQIMRRKQEGKFSEIYKRFIDNDLLHKAWLDANLPVEVSG